MNYNTITIRRTAPEGTVFCRFVDSDLGDDPAPTVLIHIGKAGSRLNAVADWGARLLGTALRQGADPETLAEITADISHADSNGHHDAKSVADAVAQSLDEYQRLAGGDLDDG